MNDLSMYNPHREAMQSGDHISWEGQSLLACMIRLKSHRSHSSVVFRPEEFGMLRERRWIIEADQGEVNARLLGKRLTNYNGKAFWHPLKPVYDLYRRDIEQFLLEHIGDPYDYEGLLANAFGHIRQNKDRWICSELAGTAYIECIPRNLLRNEWLRSHNEQLERLLKGEVLRPGELATLPIYESEVRIL